MKETLTIPLFPFMNDDSSISLFNAFTGGIFKADSSGQILQANRSATVAFGRPSSRVQPPLPIFLIEREAEEC